MRVPQDIKSISNVLKRLRGCCGTVDSLIVLMEEEKIEEPLMIQYQKEMLRGLQNIENWANDGHKQFHNILVSRGTFNAGGAEIAQKPGRVFKTKAKKKAKKKKKGG